MTQFLNFPSAFSPNLSLISIKHQSLFCNLEHNNLCAHFHSKLLPIYKQLQKIVHKFYGP